MQDTNSPTEARGDGKKNKDSFSRAFRKVKKINTVIRSRQEGRQEKMTVAQWGRFVLYHIISSASYEMIPKTSDYLPFFTNHITDGIIEAHMICCWLIEYMWAQRDATPELCRRLPYHLREVCECGMTGVI